MTNFSRDDLGDSGCGCKAWIALLSVMFLCVASASCKSISYDLRGLKKPVTMSRNPFCGPGESRPLLNRVDDHAGKVYDQEVFTSNGQNATVTKDTFDHKELQAEINEALGENQQVAITHVGLQSESNNMYAVFAAGCYVSISSTGTVHKVEQPVRVDTEAKP